MPLIEATATANNTNTNLIMLWFDDFFVFRIKLKNQKSMECGKYYKVALVASILCVHFSSILIQEWLKNGLLPQRSSNVVGSTELTVHSHAAYECIL